MADPSDIERDLQILATELRKLEAEYNMFFTGRIARPPSATRSRVDGLIKRYDRMPLDTAAQRFRFATLQARYVSFAEHWDRTMRAKEEGRPSHVLKRAPAAPAPPVVEPAAPPGERVVHVASFSGPRIEREELLDLYKAVMTARRENGEAAVSFEKFATVVGEQVGRVRESGSREVAFRVTVKDGKVNLTVRGTKGAKG